jgi:hypothetical protein
LSARRAAGQLSSPFNGIVVTDDATYEASALNMLASQIHMLNNRLGLAPAQEILLAQGLSLAARDWQAETTLEAVRR